MCACQVERLLGRARLRGSVTGRGNAERNVGGDLGEQRVVLALALGEGSLGLGKLALDPFDGGLVDLPPSHRVTSGFPYSRSNSIASVTSSPLSRSE